MKLNWAERWAVNSPPRAMIQARVMRWMKEAYSLNPGDVILEIGCGRGIGIALILQEFQPVSLHALDEDPEMIRSAHTHVLSRRWKSVYLCRGDAVRLPYRDGFFDGVFGFGFLHHVVDWRSALIEIARVLRPGGAYFLEEFYPQLYANVLTKYLFRHPENDRFSSSDLRETLTGVKLSLVKAVENTSLGILGVCIKDG